MKDAMEVMLQRRSIRAFDGTPVDGTTLKQIAEAGLYACNGCGEQKARIILITKRETLDELRALVADRFHAMSLSRFASRERTIQKAKKDRAFDFTYGGTALLLAVAPRDWQHSMADCACMLQNVQNAAFCCGLGSCWVNQIRWLCDDADPELLTLLFRLGVNEEETVFGSVSIGHPLSPAPEPKPRKAGRLIIIE